MRCRRAAEEWKDKANDPEGGRLLPFLFEHGRIELRAGEKGKHDSADAGEEFDPRLIDAEHALRQRPFR